MKTPPALDLFEHAQCLWAHRAGSKLAVRVLRPPHASAPSTQLPLLLLHGHPQSMAMWHAVAPALAQTRTVVMVDLLGYGDSDRPEPGDQDQRYSKRAMALDALAAMQTLGIERFDTLAHDRGARVAHRLAADHPQAVRRLMLLDIAPTLAMYQQTSEAFARAYWHWFFLIQPNGLPESLINADPLAYLRACMGGRRANGLAGFAPKAMAQYERCMLREGSGRGIAADYRASAGIDLEHDRADVAAGNKLTQPLHVLWGDQGAVARNFDVMACWQERAERVSGKAVPCSHYIAEDLPELTVQEAFGFLDAI